MRRDVRWGEVAAALGLFAIVGLIVLPPYTGSGPAKPSPCLKSLKGTLIGLLVYASDADDRLPPGGAWMDLAKPYGINEPRCPSVREGDYGYAFNARLSLTKLKDDGATTPMVYDSTNLARNATDAFASLPIPGRHENREGSRLDNVGYADGHAKAVPAP